MSAVEIIKEHFASSIKGIRKLDVSSNSVGLLLGLTLL